VVAGGVRGGEESGVVGVNAITYLPAAFLLAVDALAGASVILYTVRFLTQGFIMFKFFASWWTPLQMLELPQRVVTVLYSRAALDLKVGSVPEDKTNKPVELGIRPSYRCPFLFLRALSWNVVER
jgi:hypothetical protein